MLLRISIFCAIIKTYVKTGEVSCQKINIQNSTFFSTFQQFRPEKSGKIGKTGAIRI